MARQRELTISEEMELNWDDGMHDAENERYYVKDFELGWEQRSMRFKEAGHTKLLFDPMGLVI